MLPPVDWSWPWLAPYRDIGLRLSQRLQAGSAVHAALNAEWTEGASAAIHLPAGVLRFVPQADLPPGVAYEAHIADTARVPTRHNLHDLLNGLVWLRYPRIKRQLNHLQAAELRTHGVTGTRGSVRDALTLFDENAAWLQAPPVLAEALARRDWVALFLTHREAWAQAPLTLFGHALLEKLCRPRKGITAHVWLLPPSDEPAGPEPWLCEQALTPQRLAARLHHPLPVLGVPGWWPANASPRFYDDATVFRPAGRVAAGAGPAQ